MSAAAEPARPLLLIPGVCGTILNTRAAGARGEGERAWVSLSGADLRYQKLWGTYDRSSGRVEGLSSDSEEVLVPTNGDASGLYPISILDPDVQYGLPVVHYFDTFVEYLTSKQGYTCGTDLFGFGYDFRQSNSAHVPALLDRLRSMHALTGRRADILSHSMGALVVRSLLIDHAAEFEKLVETWIAVAAPFGGAPGFGSDALLTGVQFAGSLGAYFFVDRGTFRQACVQSPAVYELLPPPHFPYAAPAPELTLVAVPSATHPSMHRPGPEAAAAEAAAGVRTLGPKEAPLASWHEAHEYKFALDQLGGVLQGVLEGNSVSIGGQAVAMPFNPDVWQRAVDSHSAWSACTFPRTSRFYNLYGKGYPTPYSLQYGSWWFPVSELKALPHANASYTYVDGDGTVPTESAMADGFDAVERVGLVGAHRPLISMQSAWDQITTWIRAGGEPAGGAVGGGFQMVGHP
ncbi:Lecithin-cholesterol acyltransferase-like 4 [Auxenochlorella protothecoides]|uniref:Lecithin-cholesterol acyltransferase-like 4 n=1 Tax=Auxenochlorella protothecoides TaxID=3075 RepID=A0A087SQJ0_AUXPR|nr:Lecithin-cholesterol acyltransferase-like 4 [Auxenochlorella protothecoides]KFM27994.1 Lecithin-cholesterol acyltransferase-like 4 [Auxenochlorella protothecoides]